ncbi:MAG: N-acetylglucosamine kinase [Candidatus Acidiferrales bacterium]
MRYVLGFDGGGTKTECVLMDEAGKILAQSRSGPSNPVNIGTEASVNALADAATLALRSVAKAEAGISYICGGIAGASESSVRGALQWGLQPKFPNAMISITSDLVLSLAATGEYPVVVVIAGTGSAVLGRVSPVELARAGGFGPAIGDPGSAYDIGRKTTALVLQKHLNKENFPLGEGILRSMRWKWNDLLDQARSKPAAVFPKLFPIVAKAAESGDPAARKILASAARDLHELAREVIAQLHLQDKNFFLAKTGGVFRGSAFLNYQFDCLARETAPKVRIGPLPRSVAEAAAELARAALNSPLKFDES